MLGFALLNIKQYNKAIQEFNSSISYTPQYYLPYTGLGNTYMALGQKEKATENFDMAVKLNDLDKESQQLLDEARE
jgi:Tfp pilus assembly protein PilF